MAAKYGTGWSEDDIAFLRSHFAESTFAEIAAQLGRSAQATAQKASALGLGKETHSYRGTFSNAEIDFIRVHSDRLYSNQMAEHLGRNVEMVRRVAKRAGITLMAAPNGVTARPVYFRGQMQIGPRTLVAKSCTKCGRLLPARRFSRINKDGRRGNWASACRSCAIASNTARAQADRAVANTRGKKFSDKIASYTRRLAVKNYEPWSNDDDSIVCDVSKSLIEVAVTIGRTYAATSMRATQLGVKRTPNPDQHKQWVVTLNQSSAQAANELQQQGLMDDRGIPTEEEWDWDEVGSVSA